MDLPTWINLFKTEESSRDELLASLSEHQLVINASEHDVKSLSSLVSLCFQNEAQRISGLKLMFSSGQQVSDENFAIFGKTWFDKLLKIINQIKPNETNLFCKNLILFINKAKIIPERNKYLSNVSNKILEFLLKWFKHGHESASKCLLIFMIEYPTLCGDKSTMIQDIILQNLGLDFVDRELQGQIFSRLPFIGGSGKLGIKYKDKFSQLSNKLIHTIQELTDKIFDTFGEARDSHSTFENGHGFDIPGHDHRSLIEKLRTWTSQLEILILFMSKMLETQSHVSKGFSLKSCLKISFQIQGLSLKELMRKQSSMNTYIMMLFWPKIQAASFSLMSTLISVLKDDILTMTAQILQNAIRSLQEIAEMSDRSRESMPFPTLKISIFNTLKILSDNLGMKSGLNLGSKDLIPLILQDIVPYQATLTLTDNKAKKNRNSFTPSVVLSPYKVFSSALKCLNSIFLSCGSFIDASIHKDVQCVIIALLLSDSNNIMEQKMEILKTLRSLVMNPNPNWSPPLDFAANIMEINKFSTNKLGEEFRVQIENLLHPRGSDLSFEPYLSKSRVESVMQNVMKVHHTYVKWSEGVTEPNLRKRVVSSSDDNNDVGAKKPKENNESPAESSADVLISNGFEKELSDLRGKKTRDPHAEADALAGEKEEEIIVEISEEDKEKALKDYYDFSRDPVKIPERSVDASKKTPEKKKLSDKNEKPKSGVDIEAIKSLFVDDE